MVRLTSNPGKVMEQLILGALSRHIKSKKFIRSSHNRFRKGKSQSHLTKFLAIYVEMTGLVVKRRAMDYSFNPKKFEDKS